MDEIEILVSKIRHHESINRCRFNNNFLNSVAEVFLKWGFEITRLFLKSKQERRDPHIQVQANALLNVLDLMENYQIIIQNRGIGRLVIKTLKSILKEKTHAKHKKF